MKFKFKPNAECNFGSEDLFYSLTDGGYIVPEDLLVDSQQAEAVREAAKLVKEFLEEVNERYGEESEYEEDEE